VRPVTRRRTRLAADERGVVLFQVGIMLLALVGIVSFAIDYGILWLAREQAQNAADAGALYAATSLAFDDMSTPSPFGDRTKLFAGQTRVWGEIPVVDNPVFCDDRDACPNIQGLPRPEVRTSFAVTVNVYRDRAHNNALPTFFARVFGVADQEVRAQAKATVAPVNVATCVWPLAMPDDWFPASPPRNPPSPACPQPQADQYVDPFVRYAYPPGPPALCDKPNDYVPPSVDSDDYLPTGYQLLELNPTMQPTGLDPQSFDHLLGPDPMNPTVWAPARRSGLVPVRIGAVGFNDSMAACNPTKVPLGEYLPIDANASWTDATKNALDLVGRDGATWDTAAARIRGSCAVHGTCGAISPRLVLLPLFDPVEYDATRLGSAACGGLPCIKAVNFVGFFIDSRSDATHIVGHLTTYPGRLVDMTKPFIGYKWAFMRTAILTR